MSCRCCAYLVVLLTFVTCLVEPCCAFPKTTSAINSSTTKFSRQRVILKSDKHKRASAAESSSSVVAKRQQRRKTLLQIDTIIGMVYATGFFLFPRRTLEVFFNYPLEYNDPSLPPGFWNLVVRMIAINHMGYIAGLLLAPPELAIRVATAFLTLGGAFVVYYGQAQLDTATMFWSCTVLTTLLVAAHLLLLF